MTEQTTLEGMIRATGSLFARATAQRDGRRLQPIKDPFAQWLYDTVQEAIAEAKRKQEGEDSSCFQR